MSSSNLKAAIVRRFVLVSAGVLLHTSGALAGQPAADAQQQARDLLSGPVSRSPSTAVGEHWVPNVDPQEHARRLILGMPNLGGTGPTVVPQLAESTLDNHRAYVDSQELARSMVLRDEAPKTSSARRSASMAHSADSR
jgi:hypothetical protein